MAGPYALLSDQHLHNWSAFATPLPSGINSRLQIILDELVRAADELQGAGGDTMVFAGDLFHVRGSIDPSVLNPALDTISAILDRGVKIVAIPGNHDLKSKETTELGNAIQSLGKLDGFTVITEPQIVEASGRPVAMIPWHATCDGLRGAVRALQSAYTDIDEVDLVIHAPVNGVIMGIPDHGFDASELADFGFRRAFAGHYHDHKSFAGGVYSIGASTHQTWSDIGTRAGFLLVDDFVTYRASHAPKFVEITDDTDEAEIPLIVDGNYVRVRFETITPAAEKELRAELEGMNARGVVIQATRAPAVTRTGATVKTGATLEASVGDYIVGLAHPKQASVVSLCNDILSRARAAATAVE